MLALCAAEHVALDRAAKLPVLPGNDRGRVELSERTAAAGELLSYCASRLGVLLATCHGCREFRRLPRST